MRRRRSERMAIADTGALDDDIRKWGTSIDLQCLAELLAARHGHLQGESTAAVMMYVICRVVELNASDGSGARRQVATCY